MHTSMHKKNDAIAKIRTRRLTALVGSSALVATLVATPALAADSLQLIPDLDLFGALDGVAGYEDDGGLGAMWVMLISFVLLIFPLNALIFQPIFRALDERAERIQGARDRSTQLEEEADSVLDRYESAIRDARAESEEARQAQLATAREEQVSLTTAARSAAEGELDRARTELNQSLEEARATLRASADDLATAAAERILGRPLS